MGSSPIALLHNDFINLQQSLPDRVKRPELFIDDVLKLVFELGRYDVITQQLCARSAALKVIDDASYAEAGAILSEANAIKEWSREFDQKCDALFAEVELFEKFQHVCKEMVTILETKTAAWEGRDKRRKLTLEQVLEMHRDYEARNATMRQLAKRFTISVSTVSNIINRRYWKD